MPGVSSAPEGAARCGGERRQIAFLDEPALGDDRRAFDDVAQLTHVAGPRVRLERRHRRRIDRRDRPAVPRVELVDEHLNEQRQVVLALTQRRQRDLEDVEPVVEVFPQLAVLDGHRRVLVRRGDDADVHRLFVFAADAPERALLQDPQQLHLRGRRHLGDLVEEQRAVVGELETALAAFDGAGERAFLVTEQFALEQGVGNGGAVDRDVRRVGARAQLVERLGDELLAGAGLAADQHRRVGRRGVLDHLIDLAHLGALADHRAERAVFAELAPQHAHLAQRRVALDDLAQQDPEPLQIDRLGEVVVRALLDGFDRRFDRALRRQDHGRDGIAAVVDPAEQIEASHLRHDQVGQDDGGMKRFDLREGLLAVGSHLDVEPPAANQLLETDARGAVVLDDQNAFTSGHRIQSSRFYRRRAKNTRIARDSA